ncbi:hypothetical protein ACLMAJ_12980 [Nocardia sp. KC 131]|uniref:hypothetical protein n=1 Tax=Nocardia arseniciresistens TaxID=3392119 RepID=UPI00398ED275
MSDDKAPASPLTNFIGAAREGRLLVRMDPEQFVYLDRDCQFFKDQIRLIQTDMDAISKQESWGLGEHYVGKNGKDLISGKTMVKRYREKAKGSNNGVYEVMESHYKIVEDFQSLFRTIRERLCAQDATWAATYRDKEANLPQRPPTPARIFSWPMPVE